jgi:hypothetical protein
MGARAVVIWSDATKPSGIVGDADTLLNRVRFDGRELRPVEAKELSRLGAGRVKGPPAALLGTVRDAVVEVGNHDGERLPGAGCGNVPV